jgi:hypothetical protein
MNCILCEVDLSMIILMTQVQRFLRLLRSFPIVAHSFLLTIEIQLNIWCSSSLWLGLFAVNGLLLSNFVLMVFTQDLKFIIEVHFWSVICNTG